MREIIQALSFGCIAVFGVLVSAAFCGADKRKKSAVELTIVCAVVIAAQIVCRVLFGFNFTRMAYPLIVHLPLVIYLILVSKKTWIVCVVCVLSAYQCCQIPRWFADISGFIANDRLVWNLTYIFSLIPTFYLLKCYVAAPTENLLSRSTPAALALGTMPLLYYIFDYTTTVFTNLLYSGHPFAVQFMPSVMSVFYFFFVLIYHSQLERRENASHERDILALQLQRSDTQISSIRHMHEQAAQYRHDLRHHFALLLGLAQEKDFEKITLYLLQTQEDLDAFTPTRYSGHEIADLLLSYFSQYAQSQQVHLLIEASLPSDISIADTDLCSLLSNGLENAIRSASQTDMASKTVSVTLFVRQRNLLLQIDNPYDGTIRFENGLPIRDDGERGIGTRSIASIVKVHGGQLSFEAKDGVFSMRTILPLEL